jgi:membrane protein
LGVSHLDWSKRRLVSSSPQHGNERGHRADRPNEIPKPGWWSILRRVYTSLSSKHLSILAGGAAFYAMLALFPALAALVAVYGLWTDPATVQRQVSEMHGSMPGEAQNLIVTYLKTLVSAGSAKLGIKLIVSVLVALWSARAGTVSLIQALNVTYEEPEKRGLIRREAVALGITVTAILFVIVALVLIAAIPAALHLVPLGEKLRILGYIIPWPVLIILMSTALAATYRYAPSRREPKWRWLSWGGLAATLLWVVASALFSVYVAKFGHYDKTFGSLGAVVVLLMWLYISAYIVLLGACLDAEIERQTARDTTEGAKKPIGA